MGGVKLHGSKKQSLFPIQIWSFSETILWADKTNVARGLVDTTGTFPGSWIFLSGTNILFWGLQVYKHQWYMYKSCFQAAWELYEFQISLVFVVWKVCSQPNIHTDMVGTGNSDTNMNRSFWFYGTNRVTHKIWYLASLLPVPFFERLQGINIS